MRTTRGINERQENQPLGGSPRFLPCHSRTVGFVAGTGRERVPADFVD
jgi:hypothetical protein